MRFFVEMEETGAGVGEATREATDAPPKDSVSVSSPSAVSERSPAYVSIRRHTSAYVSIRQHASACVSIREHASAYVSMRQHT